MANDMRGPVRAYGEMTYKRDGIDRLSYWEEIFNTMNDFISFLNNPTDGVLVNGFEIIIPYEDPNEGEK